MRSIRAASSVEREVATSDDHCFAARCQRQDEAYPAIAAERFPEFLRDESSGLSVSDPDRHLETRPLGEFAEQLNALDRDAGRFITGSAVELHSQEAALTRLRSGLKRRCRLIIEGRCQELARAVAERGHHIAPPSG